MLSGTDQALLLQSHTLRALASKPQHTLTSAADKGLAQQAVRDREMGIVITPCNAMTKPAAEAIVKLRTTALQVRRPTILGQAPSAHATPTSVPRPLSRFVIRRRMISSPNSVSLALPGSSMRLLVLPLVHHPHPDAQAARVLSPASRTTHSGRLLALPLSLTNVLRTWRSATRGAPTVVSSNTASILALATTT